MARLADYNFPYASKALEIVAHSRFSLEAIVLGRNDEYEPNWSKKLMASIAYNRAQFEGSNVDYRVAFVEWNPPRDKPLLAPVLVERFDFLRAIVVDADVHDNLSTSPLLIMMLNFACNSAVRTSTSDFCMISAGDLFFGRTLAGFIKEVGLARNCLYRAERVNIRNDLDFSRATPDVIEDPANIVSINSCTEPPYDVPPYTHACGDFLLMDRLSMLGLRGFDEGIRSARLHLDSRFCRTAMEAGLNCNLSGQIFHISHNNSYTNLLDNYKDKPYDYESDLPYLNPVNWGLADYSWLRRGDRYWYVNRPSGDAALTIPAHFTESEVEAINAVTKRLIARKRTLRPKTLGDEFKTIVSVSLDPLISEPSWVGARVIERVPPIVETPNIAWSYSAMLALAPLGELHNLGENNRLFWEIDTEVHTGEVGIGLIDNHQLIQEALLSAAQGRQRLYLPADVNKADLLIRNGQTREVSRVAIHSVRLVFYPPQEFDETAILLASADAGLPE